MKIEVTQKDIDRATKLRSTHPKRTHCPIALAVKRKTHKKIYVHFTYFTLLNGKRTQFYSLPYEATKFIEKFDDRLPVKPFTFEVVLWSAIG